MPFPMSIKNERFLALCTCTITQFSHHISGINGLKMIITRFIIIICPSSDLTSAVTLTSALHFSPLTKHVPHLAINIPMTMASL